MCLSVCACVCALVCVHACVCCVCVCVHACVCCVCVRVCVPVCDHAATTTVLSVACTVITALNIILPEGAKQKTQVVYICMFVNLSVFR